MGYPEAFVREQPYFEGPLTRRACGSVRAQRSFPAREREANERYRWRGRISPDHAQSKTGLASREGRLADLRDDREVGVDDVGDLVLRGLPHERLRAALGEAVVGHQPALQLTRRVLECLEQRTRAAEHHDVRAGFKSRPSHHLLLDQI